MNTTLRRRTISAFAAVLLVSLIGCVASVGYVDPGSDGYAVGYYSPPGYVYGGWTSGYHVAPPRHDEGRDHDQEREHARDTHNHPPPEERHASKPAYRPAPPSRPAPSLPRDQRQPHSNHQ